MIRGDEENDDEIGFGVELWVVGNNESKNRLVGSLTFLWSELSGSDDCSLEFGLAF